MTGLLGALERDVAALASKRFLSVMEAGLVVEAHPETVRRALRSGELHGSQRGRGGTWRVRPACLDSWVDGVPCAHQEDERPVSLDQFRMRAAGARS